MISRNRDRCSMLGSISDAKHFKEMDHTESLPSVKLWSRRQEMHGGAHM